jgi:hypothetical protein
MISPYHLARSELAKSPDKKLESHQYREIAGEECTMAVSNLGKMLGLCCIVSSCLCLHPLRSRLWDRVCDLKDNCIDVFGMVFGICFPERMNRYITRS